MTAPTIVQGKRDVESRRNASTYLMCFLLMMVFGLIILVIGLQFWHSWQVQSLLQDVVELKTKLDLVESQQTLGVILITSFHFKTPKFAVFLTETETLIFCVPAVKAPGRAQQLKRGRFAHSPRKLQRRSNR